MFNEKSIIMLTKLIDSKKDGGLLKKAFVLSVLFLCFFFASAVTYAQEEKNVRGKVTDAQTGEELIGVSIVIENTTQGTITNVTGDYNIIVTEGKTLVFSYLGYITTKIPVGADEVINVSLHSDSEELNEVVIVGFGTQKKVNVTGAVGQIDAEQMESRPVQNVSQALQGAVPGLNISTSGVGGTLNGGKSINIRGAGSISNFSSGSPLILIDGMEGDLDAINPQDIENISVLKDAASAAVYGSRAPFGVILVTTKKGSEGKTTVNYNNNYRWSTPVLLPDMMSSYEFVNYWNDADYNGGGTGQKFGPEYVQRVKDYADGKLDPSDVAMARADGKWDYDFTNANVDWMREYYRDRAPAQEHNISLNGGSEKWQYYLSANILGQEGLMRYGTDTYDRAAITAKINGDLNDYVSIGYTTRFVRTDYERPTYMDDGLFDHILRRARPTRAKYDPNGNLMSDINYVDAFENGGRRSDIQDWMNHQFRLTLRPFEGMEVIADANFRTFNQFVHEEGLLLNSYMADGVGTYRALTSISNDYVYGYAHKSNFINPNIYGTYTKSLGLHNIKGMAGFQAERNFYRDLSASRRDLISPDLPVLDLTTHEFATVSGQFQEWATAGFFGRINYDYNNKYLFEANLRYDGTSRFRADQRWNWFPSFSAGWNVAHENFFEPIHHIVNTFKLRGSYGSLGNQNTFGWYPTYQTIGTGASNGGWLINGNRPNTANAPGLVSTSLTWEKIKSWNVGLDFGMFNNRLTGTGDFFVRDTQDGMGPGPQLPAVIGTAVPDVNNIDTRTMGFELSVAWRDIIDDFSYGIRFNLSDAQTKVMSYPNETGNINTYLAGYYTGEIWGYQTIGIAKSEDEMQRHLASLPNGGQTALGNMWGAGDIMYKDITGDGRVTPGARTLDDHGDLSIIGNNTARYAVGIDVDASWKGFDFRMFWQGVLKRDWAPSGMVFWGATGAGEWWSTALTEHLDYFREDPNHPLGQNLDSYYPRPVFSGKNQHAQTGYLLDASYMRLKNLQVGYTLPKQITEQVNISKLRFFLSGENLITLTKLNDTLDPESIGIGRQGGTVYPLSKVVSIGLSANF